MEDIMKFLVIAGVIAFGIYKQFKKDQAQKAENESPVPIPSYNEEEEMREQEATPFVLSTPITTQVPQLKNKFQPQEEGVRSTYVPTVTTALVEEEPEQESEFAIQSTDEAKRAIIWSEIFQRKYEL